MKKYFIGILAVALAIGASSFTSGKASKHAFQSFYIYVGAQNDPSQLTSPSYYDPGSDSGCDYDGSKRCGVWADAGSGHPLFNGNEDFVQKQ